MPKPFRPFRPTLFRLVAASLLGAVLMAPAAAQKSKAEQAAAKEKLADVRQKVEALSKQQADTAAQRERLNAELAKQANALAHAARAVRQTDAELAAKQQELDALQHKRNSLKDTLTKQRAAIAELLRATYALGQGSDLRLLLGDEDVARIAQALAYSTYFQQDRLKRVHQLMADLTELETLEAAIATEQHALQATRAEREKQAQTLQQQRAQQQKLAAQADATYRDQAQRLAALKQNEQSLNRLVATLQKAMDDAARQAAASAKAGSKTPASKKPAVVVGKDAADIRGNLPWPASGAVNTYGSGVLIKASGGSDVRSVARGKVIYAGFLRGYGLLLILNHGNGWMSMYGNNETLLRGVGDAIEVGDTIGTASAPTGVNTGVYFELRKGGQPVNPRTWLSQRR